MPKEIHNQGGFRKRVPNEADAKMEKKIARAETEAKELKRDAEIIKRVLEQSELERKQKK